MALITHDDPAFELAEVLSELVAPSHDLDDLRKALHQEPDLKSFASRVKQALGSNYDPTLWNEAVRLLRERTLTSMIALCEEELDEIVEERGAEDLERIAAQIEHIPRRSADHDRAPMTAAERALAAMVLNGIPPDVWDACVAALDSGDEDGKRTACEILERWKKGA